MTGRPASTSYRPMAVNQKELHLSRTELKLLHGHQTGNVLSSAHIMKILLCVTPISILLIKTGLHPKDFLSNEASDAALMKTDRRWSMCGRDWKNITGNGIKEDGIPIYGSMISKEINSLRSRIMSAKTHTLCGSANRLILSPTAVTV